MKSTFGMSHQFLHFSNINSCNVGLNGNGSVISELLCSHKSIALAGPPNICALLSRKVANGQTNHELSSLMTDESIQRFPVVLLTKFIQGSMFVPFKDAIYIQLGIGEEGKNTIPCVKTHHQEGEKCCRSWARTIYILQAEDCQDYGTQFCTIPALKGNKDLP